MDVGNQGDPRLRARGREDTIAGECHPCQGGSGGKRGNYNQPLLVKSTRGEIGKPGHGRVSAACRTRPKRHGAAIRKKKRPEVDDGLRHKSSKKGDRGSSRKSRATPTKGGREKMRSPYIRAKVKKLEDWKRKSSKE